MTLYHFGNCLALALVPYHMIYKYSGVSEYASVWKFGYVAYLYTFTQLCKMLLLATFFPDTDSSHMSGEYKLFLDILKSTVDVADLVGLYFAMSSLPGKGPAKIFTAAVGWANAEVIITRCVMLWVGARGSEFDWLYVRSCAESNVALVQHAATAAFVWLWTRSDLPQRHYPIVLTFLAVTPYKPLLEEALKTVLGLSAWTMLAMRAAHAAASGLTALAMYAILSQQIGI